MDATSPLPCPICGKSESLKRCGSCKRVGYCSREHQREHWKTHRGECTYQSKSKSSPQSPTNMVVVVEIKSGEGSGLTNRMIDHVFNSRVQATRFIRQRLGYNQTEELKELTEMPFLRDLMGFSSGTIFVDPRQNAFPPFTKEFVRQFGFGYGLDELNDMLNCRGVAGELNAMAIYLGSKLDNGLSMSVNASGDAFFIGTTAKSQPVTSNVLWGAANFVYEAMDYYPEDYTKEEREQKFRKWSRRYALGTWEPMAGSGGVNLYQTDPFQCKWQTVDHRTPYMDSFTFFVAFTFCRVLSRFVDSEVRHSAVQQPIAPLQSHLKISLLQHTTNEDPTNSFRMLIYQQPPGGTFLRDSELSALLELVIPCYDEPLSPVEMVQFHSYGSLGYPSPASVCQSPLPVFPHQDAHDICTGGASWFPVPKDANSISLVMINNESFPGVTGVEPLTSLLRPDITLSIEPKLSLEHQLSDTQACELETPLEVYHQLKSTTAAVKCEQGQKRPCKPRAKCVVNGCNTQKQSHGRCIRHGGGKRCTVFGCSSGAQTMGLCKRHGGGSRCRVLNCGKSSQSGGLCRSHGGGTMCIAPGCKKGAQRQRKCAKHAPRKCAIDNCSNLSRCGGFCRRHHPFKK